MEQYFKEKDGVVPKSLNDLFGDQGALTQVFDDYFDPKKGEFVRLMDGQIGPSSKFGRLFDPQNKDGVISLIEEKVKHQVEQKLNRVLQEFSLDQDDSAMSRLHKMFQDAVAGLSRAVGVKAARAAEAERGHVKGFDFERVDAPKPEVPPPFRRGGFQKHVTPKTTTRSCI